MSARHQKTPQEQAARILIIDDEPNSIAILAGLLKEKGYQVRAAKDEKQALKSLEIEPANLILLDIRMPKVSGFELCEKIKSCKQTAGIPIIFLTALDETEDKIKGLELGAVDYITKPFNSDEVIARVRRQLQLKSEYKKTSGAGEYRKTGLDKGTRQEICRLLVHYFDEETPFISDALNAVKIAEKLGVTQHNLSEAVNLELQQNLSHFINRYRIEYFCKLYLQQPDASIFDLALRAGFKSKSAFNHWFKTLKNKTPRMYLKSLSQTNQT